jgi:hypothetical protein
MERKTITQKCPSKKNRRLKTGKERKYSENQKKLRRKVKLEKHYSKERYGKH